MIYFVCNFVWSPYRREPISVQSMPPTAASVSGNLSAMYLHTRISTRVADAHCSHQCGANWLRCCTSLHMQVWALPCACQGPQAIRKIAISTLHLQTSQKICMRGHCHESLLTATCMGPLSRSQSACSSEAHSPRRQQALASKGPVHGVHDA